MGFRTWPDFIKAMENCNKARDGLPIVPPRPARYGRPTIQDYEDYDSGMREEQASV